MKSLQGNRVTHHSEQFAPNTFVLPAQTVTLEYGYHAADRAAQKNFRLPKMINLSEFQVIEIEFTDGAVTKLLIRGHYDNRNDICLVLIPGRNFVKTAWLNRKTDTHKTLDLSKYSPVRA